MTPPRRPAPMYVLPGSWPGLVRRGNIDLLHRPVVRNRDGSVSTVRTISAFDPDLGLEVLLPTVVGDRIVSNRAAVAHYRATGKHLGMFRTVADADRYAAALHLQQARYYLRSPHARAGR